MAILLFYLVFLTGRMARLLGWLVQPTQHITEPERRFQAQLLATFLIVVIPLSILAAMFSQIHNLSGGHWTAVSLGLGSVTAFLTVMYFLSRTRYYPLAAWLSIVAAALLILALTINLSGNPSETLYYLDYLIIPVILAGALFRLRAMILLALLLMLSVLGLPLLLPHMALLDVRSLRPFSFLLVTTAVFLVVARHWQRLEAYRRERLEEHNEEFRVLFELAPLGLATISLEGAILRANEALGLLLGYTADELQGTSVLALVRPEAVALIRQQRDAIVARQQYSYQAELILLCRDGVPLPVWLQVTLARNTQGKPHYFIAQVVDLSAQQAAEQQRLLVLLERERIDLMQRFISDITHEFRNPLMTINSAVYLLRRLDDAQKRARQLDAIQGQSDYLSRMVDGLLYLTRLDRVQAFDLLPADPVALAETAGGRFDTLAAERGVTLDVEAPAALPAIMADVDELCTALGCLVENAILYSAAGTTVVMRVSIEGEAVVLAVQDQGAGIAEADLAHIFDRLFRADKARPIHLGGIGLGLPIAQRIVELHGGTLTVESQPGIGSTFSIRLPAG